MPPILNFQTLRPATPVDYIRAQISVPAFSYEGPIWKGASEVVVQYNYTAERAFVLKNRPTKPTGVNYCPVIRFRVGYTTYRYKLWQDVGERLAEPLYTGQVIKANFVIEIWNTSDSNSVVSVDGFTVELGTKKIPATDYSSLANYTGSEVLDTLEPADMISNVQALDTTGLLARYTAEGWAGSGNLEDQYGSFDLTINGTPTVGPDYVNPNSSNGQFYPIRLDTGDYFSGPSPFAGLGTTHYLVGLLAQHVWADGEFLFGSFPEGAGAAQVIQRTSSANLAVKTSGPTYGTIFPAEALDAYGIIVLELNPLTLSYAGVGNNRNSQVTMAGLVHPATLQIGAANVYFSDLLVFGPTGDIDAAVDYLLTNRGFADMVPTEPSGDIAWLDNE